VDAWTGRSKDCRPALRRGTSIGANAEEAAGAQTKPDFIARLAIPRKANRETTDHLP
jgi:four helix bundle protein